MDTLTLLVCPPGFSATKTHTKTDGKIDTAPYNAGMYFASKEFLADGIHALSKSLMSLETIPDALVIRGAPQPHLNTAKPHQRTKNDSCCNYLTPPEGRQYAMIDIDKLSLPQGLKLSKRTLPRVIRYVINLLPKEFHNVSFHWQLSSSAGVGDPTKVSIHLWFWFDRPISDTDLKRWGKNWNTAIGFNLIDLSLFNDVQAHYTAAPIFKNMTDPFPIRSGLIEKELHEVALVLPAPAFSHTHNPKSNGNKPSQETISGQGFDCHLSTIGDHPGGEGFHLPIIRAIASHVTTVGGDNVDIEWLLEKVRERVLAADCSHHTQEEVESRASREHIIQAIEGAIDKFGHQPTKAVRVISGVKPHYTTKTVSKRQSQKKLDQYFSKMF